MTRSWQTAGGLRQRVASLLAGLAFLGLAPAVYFTHMYGVGQRTTAPKDAVLTAERRFLRRVSPDDLSCTYHEIPKRMGTTGAGEITLDHYLQLHDALLWALNATQEGGYANDDALNLHHLARFRPSLIESIRVLDETSYAASSHLREILRAYSAACAETNGAPKKPPVNRVFLQAHLDAIKANLATMKTAYAQWEKIRPTFRATVWTLIVLEVVGYGCAFWLIVGYLRERRRRRAGADSPTP